MVKLTVTVKEERFKFLWCKRVTGFDPGKHCAACLLGSYVVGLPRTKRLGDVIPRGVYSLEIALGRDIGYLCGVTSKWADNLHVAFVADPGVIVRVSTPLVSVRLEGASLLAIPDPIPVPGYSRDHWRCRCWCFGMTLGDSLPKQAELF